VTDPGGRLQDIADPELRRAVARLRGTRGQAKQARDRGAEGTRTDAHAHSSDRMVDTSAPAVHRRTVLTQIMNEAKLPSDRIRAAEALRREEEEQLAGHGDAASVFLAYRAMLEQLPPTDRLTWLREEMGRDAGDLDPFEWEEEEEQAQPAIR